MANIKSQKKRIKTNEKSRLRNKAVKSQLRTHVRGVRAAIAEGDQSKAAELLKETGRAFDKAVSKGVLHANQAANKKSALAQATNALG